MPRTPNPASSGSPRFDQILNLGPQPMRRWSLTTLQLERRATITFDDVDWRVGAELLVGAGTANWWLQVAPKDELDLRTERRLRAKDTFRRLWLALHASRPLAGGWMPTASGIIGSWYEHNLAVEDAWHEFNRPIRLVDPEKIIGLGPRTLSRLKRPRSQAELTRRTWRLVELVRGSPPGIKLVRTASWQRRDHATSATRGWSIIRAVFLHGRAANASVSLSHARLLSASRQEEVSRGVRSHGLTGSGTWQRMPDGSWSAVFELPNVQTARAREQIERLDALPMGELLGW